MKNPIVDEAEARDIRDSVHRLLRDLGNPEPPLNLTVVRDRLELDRGYYSSKSTSGLDEFVHKLRVGTKQIAKRPMLLVDAIRTLSLRALYFPDTKRILIDEDLPKLKHRWAEGHEIGHSLIWWHKDYLLGDSETELSPACHAVIEAEANFACGQLLFLQQRFVDDAMSLAVEFKSISALHARYGNTLTSTLWRFIESHQGSRPLVAIVSSHPQHSPPDFNPRNPCRYCVQSPAFRLKFSRVTEVALFGSIRGYCWSHQKPGPLGNGEVALIDDNGETHMFHFQSFSNKYEVLTLGSHVTPLSRTVSRPNISAAI